MKKHPPSLEAWPAFKITGTEETCNRRNLPGDMGEVSSCSCLRGKVRKVPLYNNGTCNLGGYK
jgi:hypothetical protein